MIYLESAYRHQAIVFRRFTDLAVISVRKMLENLGLRDIELISTDLDKSIFEIADMDNPEGKAIFADYINPANGKLYTVSLYIQPIEKIDGTLYMRVTYTKPGDVADDRKSVFSKSEPLVVSFLIVYDFQPADGKAMAISKLEKGIDSKLDKGNEQLTKEEMEFIHGCYELDRLEKYISSGQFYYARNRWNDALLMFQRALKMLNCEIESGEAKDKLQYALICMYVSKCYQQKGMLDKAMYYISLARCMDYIYETDEELMRREYCRGAEYSAQINIGYILNRILDIDASCISETDSKSLILGRMHKCIAFQNKSESDKSEICDNSAVLINANIVKDTCNQDIIRVDITQPHFAQDNDKFSDEKYNIPYNATFVLSASCDAAPCLRAESMDSIVAEAELLCKDKFYIEAMLRAEFAIQKLKGTFTRDNARKANYIKALSLMAECCNRLSLNEKAVFYASEFRAVSAGDCGPAYAHCLIDAEDPRAEAEVMSYEPKTAKMQLWLHRKEEEASPTES